MFWTVWMNQYSSGEIPQRIMGYCEGLEAWWPDFLKSSPAYWQRVSWTIIREGMPWRPPAHRHTQLLDNGEKRPQKGTLASARTEKLLPGLSHVWSIKWHPSEQPYTTRGEGWASHCYADEMQETPPNSRRPLQQWLKRLSQDVSTTCARH